MNARGIANRLICRVGLVVATTCAVACVAEAEDKGVSDDGWKVVAKYDCTQQQPVSTVGTTRVVDSPMGRYLEGGARVGDRFVYSFRVSGETRLLRATVMYPDDKARTSGVAAWGPPQEALGSGFMCGDDIPLTHRMVRRQFVYYGRGQDEALVFSTEAPNQPVAIANLVVEEGPATLPASPLPKVFAKNHRRMGLAWEDPILSRCFGEPDSVDGDSFDVVLKRCMDYSKWSGLSEISYPAYWYNGPMFDSKVMPNYPVANRLHPPDALVRLAKQCDSNDIAYFPVLNVYKLRPLKDHTLEERDVIAGKANINTVGADGRVVTWDKAEFWRDSVSVTLNPIVQDACRSLLVEVANQCAPFASFAGVDLPLWPGTILKLGSSAPGDAAMSFDDFTVDAFCTEQHLDAPGALGEKDRFAKRAKWLREDPLRWKAWMKWRAAGMTKFYISMADQLAAIKPGAKLGICIYMAHGRPENETVNINDQIYASGIDLAALASNPSISIKRYGHQMLPRWRFRNGMPRPNDLNIENTAKFQSPFADLPGMGFLVHQQYFETRADVNGAFLTLPEPFPSEQVALRPNGSIRVTEPLPTGRDYLRFFANAIRNYDPDSMSVGGYVLGTQGAEPELREMATAFSALPAAKFEDVLVADQVVVRRHTSEEGVWVYAVSLTPDPLSIRISLADGNAKNAVTGQDVSGSEGRITVPLKPYQLVSLCGPASMKVLAAGVEPQASR